MDADLSLGEPFKREEVSFPAFGDENTALFSQLGADSDPSSLAIIDVRVGRFHLGWSAFGDNPLDTILSLMPLLPEDPEAERRNAGGSVDALLPTIDELPIGYTLEPGLGTPPA